MRLIWLPAPLRAQTYHTLKDMRMVLLDGTVLDTADPASRAAFLKVLSCLLRRC